MSGHVVGTEPVVMKVTIEDVRRIPRSVFESHRVFTIPSARVSGDKIVNVMCLWHPDDLGRRADAISDLAPYFPGAEFLFAQPGVPDPELYLRNFLDMTYNTPAARSPEQPRPVCGGCGNTGRQCLVAPSGRTICMECVFAAEVVSLQDAKCDFCESPLPPTRVCGGQTICHGCVTLARELVQG